MSLELDRVALTIGGRPLVKDVSLTLNPERWSVCSALMAQVKPPPSIW